MKKKFGYFVLLGFFLIQIGASLLEKNIYPFSPYRMFSKHWESGIVMDYVSFADENDNEYSVSSLLKEIPFFQANHLSFITFLDASSAEQKKILCQLLMRNIPTTLLKVFAQERLYERDSSGVVRMRIEKKELVHECKKK